MLVTPPAGVAMPIIKTLTDCASYSTTVEPYIPQLYALPEQILANIGDLEALKNIYASTNPIISGFAFSLALFPIFLVVSEVNRNWSQVDRVWSILPTLYHIHYAVWARMNGLETQRVDNVMAFSVLWSIRLTFNYWRRGGYQIGSEDYRWNLIKGWIGTPAFFILNILFTSSVQSVRSSSYVLPAPS
jgi:steroid 5-alpha reductase family enzyme